MKQTKPGYKTTEFWLAFAASLVSFAYASGVLQATPTSWDDRVVGIAAGVLSSLGYSISRTLVKR